ncbi:MAG TPA: SRPBCC family protein [Ktedonobacterales bacterium]
MIKTEKSIVIDAPVEKVFAYVYDPANEPEYMTGVHEVKDVQRLPDGRYTYTEVSKFLGVPVDFECEYTEVIPNERIVEKVHGPGMDGHMSMGFERLETGKTRVSIVGETSLHGGPLAKFGESFLAKYFDHGSEMAIHGAKAHIEAAARVAATR